MKRENLQLMADHMRTVKQFDMGRYRDDDDFNNPECGSVGCIIGNCTVLDSKNVIKNFTDSDGEINFTRWSEDFTGIDRFSDQWAWCFSYDWKDTDNTPVGAALRIEWLLKNGLPENWKDQMSGYDELCYM